LELNINSHDKTVIDVTSVDGAHRYHRGMHSGSNTNYAVRISVPKTLEKLMINRDTIKIESNPVIYTIQ